MAVRGEDRRKVSCSETCGLDELRKRKRKRTTGKLASDGRAGVSVYSLLARL